MGAGFNRWWLLPLGILVASALVSLNVVVFGPSFVAGFGALVYNLLPHEPVALRLGWHVKFPRSIGWTGR